MHRPLTDEQKGTLTASGLILFAANLLPAIAVWKLNWTLYDLFVLYWAEIILTGIFNVIRMIVITPHRAPIRYHLLKIAFVPFFAGHFGLFCAGLGIAVQALFGKENFDLPTQAMSLVVGQGSRLFWPLVIARLLSFFWNYLGHSEYRKTSVTRRMTAPYIRVIPSILLLAGGGYGAIALDSLTKEILIGFIVGKATLDLLIHLLMHRWLIRQPERQV